jgi:hypothetical protein
MPDMWIGHPKQRATVTRVEKTRRMRSLASGGCKRYYMMGIEEFGDSPGSLRAHGSSSKVGSTTKLVRTGLAVQRDRLSTIDDARLRQSCSALASDTSSNSAKWLDTAARQLDR